MRKRTQLFNFLNCVSAWSFSSSSPFYIARGRSAVHLRCFSTSSCQEIAGRHHYKFMEVFNETMKHACESPERTAITADQRSYSFAQIIGSAIDIRSTLLSKLVSESNNGTKSLGGARVGIVAKPSPEFVAAMLATWSCGGVSVPLAPSYPEAELLHVMNDSDISMVLSSHEHQQLMEDATMKCSASLLLLPGIESVSSSLNEVGVSDNGAAHLSNIMEHDICKIEGSDPALILYTSGTTGKPKGVVHTHNSIISQVQILTEAWEYTSEDNCLNCLPLHHVHGLFNALFAPLYAGAVVEFMPKFSVRGLWQRWRESYPKDGCKASDAITLFTGVPTMYSRLLQGYQTMDMDQQSASAFAARNLRLMMCGSSALPYPVMKQWEETTGHRLLERYGMTEFVMALSNPLHGVRKGGTVGKPLPRVEVKILMEDGSESKTGEGELCVKSPSLFKEYWRRPEVTKESFIDGGFFKTGDTVTTDKEGYFIILGRTNADIMKVGGYKLSALEIEAVLLEHVSVSECCVLGYPDKDYGEVVCAIIVPPEDAKQRAQEKSQPVITLEDLSTWAKEKLAPYKVPTKLFLRDSLPRNAMGKVNKKELKRLLVESEGSQNGHC